MSYLLSVDSGTRKCGGAFWCDSYLLAAQLIEVEETPSRDGFTNTIEAMANAVCLWSASDVLRVSMLAHAQFRGPQNDFKLVCEYPRTYGGRAKKGDANDLVGVALVAGAILGRLACPSRLVLPEDWKGSAPKPKSKAEYLRNGYVVEQRARLKLSAEELTRVRLPDKDWKKALDVWDAVGIGLWAFGR